MAWIARVGLAALVAVACGSEEAPRPSGAPMEGAAVRRPADRGEAPTITSVQLEPSAPVPGKRVRAVVNAEDPDGDPLRLDFVWRVDGSEIAEHRADFVLDPSVPKGAWIEVSVTATDGHHESTPVRSSGEVGNQPPELMAVVLEPRQGVAVGSEITAQPEAQDPDGDRLEFRYEWRVNGRPAEASERSFSTAGLQRGDTVEVAVIASDGAEQSRRVTSAPLQVGNAAPQIVSRPGGLDASGSFRYALEATDPDGDRNLRFKLLSGPEGMTLDPVTGEVHWKPGAAQAGKHEAEVAVEDGQGGVSSQRFEVTVRVVEEAPAGGGDAATPASPGPEDED